MKSKTIYIYKVTNNINGLIYIGQTAKTGTTFDKYFGSGRLIKKAIKEFDIENFNKVILAKCNGVNIASKLEIDFIERYNSIKNGYNIFNGGNGKAFKHSFEVIEYLREINIGKEHSKETKKKMSKNNSGENNPFYGKHHSENVKKIIGDKNKIKIGSKNPFYGKHHTEETKNKISKANKDRKLSEETKKKMSESHKGIEFSVEHKNKIGLIHKNKIVSLETRRKLSESGKVYWKKRKMREAA